MKRNFLFCATLILLVFADRLLANPPTLDPTYSVRRVIEVKQKPSPLPKWIWTLKTTSNQTVYFRKTIFLKQTPKEASLSLVADDTFIFNLNGKRIGSSLNYHLKSKSFQTRLFRMDNKLRAGANLIAIECKHEAGVAGLLARLDIDGVTVSLSDRTWLAFEGFPAPNGWNTNAFDDKSWTHATEIAPYGEGAWGESVVNWPESQDDFKHLDILPKTVRALEVDHSISGSESLMKAKGCAKFSHATQTRSGLPCLLVDFGKEVSGRILISGTAGSNITVVTGESLEECADLKRRSPCSGPFHLILTGSAPVATKYSAFRYARILSENSKPFDITRIVCDHKYYPVQYKGSFDCSDPLLAKIWHTGAYTAHLCMQEEIWDAPKRDRGLWSGDLQVTGATINTVFADTKLMERSIGRLRDRAQLGALPNEMPAADVNSIPGYSAAWFCTLADYHRHIGNVRFLRQRKRQILTLLEFQRTKFDKMNLLHLKSSDWRFVDWAKDYVADSSQCRMATNLFIILGIREAVFLLKEMGEFREAARFQSWADTLAKAARTAYLDPQTQTFGERIQTNCMAILSGVATKAEYEPIYRHIFQSGNAVWHAKSMKTLDDSSAITPYSGYFLINALAKMNRKAESVDLIRRYWGAMLRRGATTWWEKFDPAWDQDFDKTLKKMHNLSSCHGWSSGPTSFLSEQVLGVRSTAAGFTSVTIQPFLGDLKWAEGDIPTPKGTIHIRSERRNSRISTRFSLPPGIHATLILSGQTIKISRPGFYSY